MRTFVSIDFAVHQTLGVNSHGRFVNVYFSVHQTLVSAFLNAQVGVWIEAYFYSCLWPSSCSWENVMWTSHLHKCNVRLRPEWVDSTAGQRFFSRSYRHSLDGYADTNCKLPFVWVALRGSTTPNRLIFQFCFIMLKIKQNVCRILCENFIQIGQTMKKL